MTRQEDSGDVRDWSDLMQLAAENVTNARWTMLPVRVVKYDPAKQCVDVQPVVAVAGPSGLPRPMPPIFCSPVVYPAWGGYRVQAPALPGDLGLLLVSSAAMASWLTTGTDGAPPASPRRQSLSDSVYLGGMHAFAPGPSAPPTPSTGLRIGATAAWIEITDPTVVLVEAPSIKLGLTAVDPLTKWPALDTMLGQILTDISALAAGLALAAPALIVQPGNGVAAIPGVNPTFTAVDPTTATVKVTGE